MPTGTPVSPIPLNDDFVASDARQAGIWIELVAIPLLSICFWIASRYWQNWIEGSDRLIYICCVGLGILAAIARASKVGSSSRWRQLGTLLFWIIAAILLASSVLNATRELAVIATAFAFAGWANGRITGERIGFALSLGLAMASPLLIDYAVSEGWFSWMESETLSVTSGLSDIAGLSHMREDQSLLFANGVADRFSSVGTVDGLLTFIGIGVFMSLLMRRGLVAGCISILISCLVWQATRASAITIFSFYPNHAEHWNQWTPMILSLVICTGIVLIVGLDQFVAAVSEPIPFEFINVDFPLFALSWNWVWGLPTLIVRVPQRESDFGPLETDE